MDQRVKERLIGAAVLLLLGVIFIPWILDGSPAEMKHSENLHLPVPAGAATHELNFKSGNVTKIDLPVPDTSSETPTALETADTTTDTTPDTATNKAAPTTAKRTTPIPEATDNKTQNPAAKLPPKPPTKPSTEPTGSIDRSTVPVETSTAATTAGTSAKSEIERIASDPSAAWVIQVGSFANQNNAEKTVADLKLKGFPAFLSRYVTPEKKVLYRVRVGPEKERSQAMALEARLLKSGFKGQLVAHP